jgi:hypothetical protein
MLQDAHGIVGQLWSRYRVACMCVCVCARVHACMCTRVCARVYVHACMERVPKYLVEVARGLVVRVCSHIPVRVVQCRILDAPHTVKLWRCHT